MAWTALLWLTSALPLLATQTNPPVTLFLNGPTNNRVNLVFLAEGYQTNQFGLFLADATNAANSFLAVEPYAEYASNFNAFAIAVSSTNSGSTHPYYGITNKTYFNTSYDPVSDYLITMPAAGSGQGQDRVNGLLKAYFGTTNNFLPVVLVNDLTQGGSDNSGTAAITDNSTGVNGSLSTIFIHETGHVLGNLGDEYTTAYPGYPDIEEPNTTTNFNSNTIKWRAWIPSGTPIPTPSTSAYADTVGLFVGAHYHTNGWYRPMLGCRMQNEYTPDFCPVCQEALVLAIYTKSRPLDSFLPATNKIVTASAQIINFSLNLVTPASHPLTIQWCINGVAVPGATSAAFSLSPTQSGTQTNVIAAVVWDNTALVRNDPKNLLWQTNAWTLVTTLPTLRLDSTKWTTNNNFSFRVTGSSPDGVVVQGSTNLANWLPLQTNLFGGQTNFFYTNLATSLPWRFYRAITPP
jgi:hypothetical protein